MRKEGLSAAQYRALCTADAVGFVVRTSAAAEKVYRALYKKGLVTWGLYPVLTQEGRKVLGSES